MSPSSPARPTWTYLLPSGAEETARQLAARELDRIADKQDRAGDATPAAAAPAKIFTAYLWPLDEDFDPRSIADDLIPIHFSWDDEALLATTMTREVEALYAISGSRRAGMLMPSIGVTARWYLGDLGVD